jgi:hypothetical protein
MAKIPFIHEPIKTMPIELKPAATVEPVHPAQMLPRVETPFPQPAQKSLDESDPTKNEYNCNSKGRCWKWCAKDGLSLVTHDRFHIETIGQWCFTSVENTCTKREDCKWHNQCVNNCQAHWGE